MARVEYAETTGYSPEMQALIDQIKEERGGRLLNLYKMLLNSPPVAAGWLHMGTAVRQQAKLDGRSRELAICMVGRLTRSEYEWAAHSPLARREGVSDQQLDVLPDWRMGNHFDQRDQAILAYAEAMTVHIEVDEPTFANIRKHFERQELVELTTTIAFYNMVSRFLIALDVDMEER